MKENNVKKIKNWFSSISGKTIDKDKSQEARPSGDSENNNYFQLARSWADDYQTVIIASRNRYRVDFLGITVLCIVSIITALSLLHTHEYIPLLVHHYEDGTVTVDQAENNYVPESQAEVESELVRYLVNRESYDPSSFSEQYKLVTLMSDNDVSQAYHHDQSSDDTTSFIATFGNRVVRSVKIQDVNFLDNLSLNNAKKHDTNHKNLAEINFVVTDKDVKYGVEKRTPYVAILSWAHNGIPNDPEARWLNWNGFTVTDFQRNQRTL